MLDLLKSARSETQEQNEVIAFCQGLGGNLYPCLRKIFHVPNGGKRTKIEASILNGMGVRAGMPDLLLPVARRGYIGLAIELKAYGKANDYTKVQRDRLIELADEGWLAVLSEGAAPAVDLLRWYVMGSRHFGDPEVSQVPVILGKDLPEKRQHARC
jgi:hypothetical protein